MRLPAFTDYESFRPWRMNAAQCLPAAIDIARSHGGSLRLSQSLRLGGLRADLQLAR